MKLNLDRYLQQEIILLNEYIQETRDWKMIDSYAYESIIKFGGKTVILVPYHRMLSYGYVYHEGAGVYDDNRNRRTEDVTTPWIACKIELEGDQSTPWHSDVLKELKEYVKEKFPWKPFYDEDACHGIYSRQCSAYIRDWTKYVFYINPDYPTGWWENHCLG